MLQRKKISGSLSGLRLKKRATQRPSCQSLPSLRDSNAIDAARNLWRRPHGLPQAVRCPRSRPIYEKRRRLRGRASLYSITGSDRSGDGRQQSTTTVRLGEELRLARNETQRFTWPPVPADVKTRGVVIPQAVFAEGAACVAASGTTLLPNAGRRRGNSSSLVSLRTCRVGGST